MNLLLVSFTILILIAQGNSTYLRNHIWRTEESLWQDCIDKYPDLWRGHHNLATAYGEDNRHEDAISEYLAALSTSKNKLNRNEDASTYHNLGIIFHRMKQDDKALYYYQEAEKINKRFAPIYLNRGNLLLEKGLLEEAASEYFKAIQYDKDLAPAFSNLGFLQLIKGETDNAIYNIEWAHYKGHETSKTYMHLGQAYRKKCMYGKAFLMFNKSLELNPFGHVTYLHLVELFSITGLEERRKKAIINFFKSFKGDEQKIKKFMKELMDAAEMSPTLLPDSNMLIKSLAEQCGIRAQDYQEMADLLEKKR